MPIPAKHLLGLLLAFTLPAVASAENPAPSPRAGNAAIELAQMQVQGMRQGRGAGPRSGMMGGGMTDRMGAQFGMIDADGDGAVTGAELLEWRDMVFDAMDADGDDALTREEFMAVQMGPGADPGQRGPRYDEMQALKAAEFDAMDEDGNGLVTRTQFTDAAAAMFLDADTDEDGALTQTEFRAIHGRPARAAP
jgi:Ca2+-binding EF-hand superfamily protein